MFLFFFSQKSERFRKAFLRTEASAAGECRLQAQRTDAVTKQPESELGLWKSTRRLGEELKRRYWLSQEFKKEESVCGGQSHSMK